MDKAKKAVAFLKQNNLILATAESCTAGLMTSIMADVPGCGSVLDGGYVVYSVRAKNDWLGVSNHTIDTFGLTSEEVAREMAIGALKSSGANIVISNTGLASADGDMDGVICFACAMTINHEDLALSETVKFDGSRNQVRTAAALHGLEHLPSYYERLAKLKEVEKK